MHLGKHKACLYCNKSMHTQKRPVTRGCSKKMHGCMVTQCMLQIWRLKKKKNYWSNNASGD